MFSYFNNHKLQFLMVITILIVFLGNITGRGALTTIILGTIVVANIALIYIVPNLIRGGFNAGAIVILLILMFYSIAAFGGIYYNTGIYDNTGQLIRNKASCLYFSIVTWTTLGYGDFHPGPNARFFAALEAIYGYIYMGVTVGAFLLVFYRATEEKD